MTAKRKTKPMTAKQSVLRRHPHAGTMLTAMWGWRIVDYDYGDSDPRVLSGLRATHKTEGRAWSAAARNLPAKGKRMTTDTERKRADRFGVLNQQRCAEAMQLLYQTYIIDSDIAEDRGRAIRAINRMILALGGEDTAAKIEAVPYSARLRESGEPELVQLARELVNDFKENS